MFSVTDVRKRLKLGEIVCDSLQLVDEINRIRKFEEEKTGKKRAKLQHKTLLEKLKDYNLVAEEIGEQKILLTHYIDLQNKKQPKYNFTESQARVFIADESIVGKILLSKFIDNLFVENEFLKFSIEHTKSTHDKLFETVKNHSDEPSKEFSKINRSINMTVDKRFGLKQGTLNKDNMNSEQLEFRALVEDKWTELYKGKKGGIKSKIESEVL